MADEGEGLAWDLRVLAGNSEIQPQLAELARGLENFFVQLLRHGFTREEAIAQRRIAEAQMQMPLVEAGYPGG